AVGRAGDRTTGAGRQGVGGRRPAPRRPVGPRRRRDPDAVTMPEPLQPALAEVRDLLLGAALVRAVAAGRRRGRTPSVVRAELRPVRLRDGHRLQVVTSDGLRPVTRNLPYGPEATSAVDALLAEPFGSWRVETTGVTLQLR